MRLSIGNNKIQNQMRQTSIQNKVTTPKRNIKTAYKNRNNQFDIKRNSHIINFDD